MRKPYDARTLRYVARKIARVAENNTAIGNVSRYPAAVRSGMNGLAIIAAAQFRAEAAAIEKKKAKSR